MRAFSIMAAITALLGILCADVAAQEAQKETDTAAAEQIKPDVSAPSSDASKKEEIPFALPEQAESPGEAVIKTETEMTAEPETVRKADVDASASIETRKAELEDASKSYLEAVSLYWDGKYAEAKERFEKVEKLSSGYARTAYYLGRIKEKEAR
jgi:TolA-binding protein